MKLNISQEMLDKLKRLKGKIALFTAATATVIGLAGCTNTDAITLPSDAPITSEMPSSEVPSSSEEMSSEEVSEELPSEDVVVEDVYSAESIMKYADELAAKYPIENPEHIKATLIMASLDKISEEDRVALFDAYGFTYETLEETFKEYLESVSITHDSTVGYLQGSEDLKNKANFSERMSIAEVVIDEAGKEFANNCYNLLSDSAYCRYTSGDKMNELYESKITSGNYSMADDVAINFAFCGKYDLEVYVSPYETFGIEVGFSK